MEKKTIGKFISTLRKANGMTQKDLAERLNVSDKTVSRWERDDGAPDLSSIPVIAEIFDVTCDELLRGERRSPEERASGQLEESDPSPKAEKQRQRLLRVTFSRYQTQSYIAMGISTAGLIAALIGNLAFYRAVLGFLMGAVFFAASIVCQAVFLNKAFLCVEDAALGPDELPRFKHAAIRLTQCSIGLTVAFIGFTFPLILVDAYLGLGSDSLIIFGLMGAVLFLLIYAVALYFVNFSLLKKGVYTLTGKEASVYHHNHRLKRICAIALVVTLAVTAFAHTALTSIWGPMSIMKGTTFHDYESFIAYMEQDIQSDPFHHLEDGITATTPVAAPAPESTVTYYDEGGNEISEEEARTRRLKDKNGSVVCEYYERNETVISMRYTPGDGTILPITVCTAADLEAARQTAAQRHAVFSGLYVLELAAVLFLYFRKKAK